MVGNRWILLHHHHQRQKFFSRFLIVKLEFSKVFQGGEFTFTFLLFVLAVLVIQKFLISFWQMPRDLNLICSFFSFVQYGSLSPNHKVILRLSTLMPSFDSYNYQNLKFCVHYGFISNAPLIHSGIVTVFGCFFLAVFASNWYNYRESLRWE